MKFLKVAALMLTLYCALGRSELSHFEDQYFQFDIPETQAEKSILKFANQAKLTFFLAYELIEGVKTRPLIGKFTLSQAINILFADTQLQATLDSKGNLQVILRKVEIASLADNQTNNIPPLFEAEDAIETIVVTGYRNKLPDNISIKKVSTNIVEILDSKTINRQADQNLSENLQNNAGVTIARKLGEGSDISVRGFGPKYNITTINGRTIATSQEDRNFDYRLLPGDFVSMIAINKSPSANTTAGSIGANIDIETAKPFQKLGFHSLATLAANYYEMNELRDYHYSGLVSNTMLDDRLGIMIGVLNDKSRNQLERYSTQRLAQSNILPENLISPVYSSNGTPIEVSIIRRPLRMIYDVQDTEQRRTSISATAQYKRSDFTVHSLDILYANYQRYSNSSGVQFPGQSPNYKNVTVDSDNSVQTATIFENNLDAVFEEQIEDINTYAVGYNSTFSFNSWFIELDLSHSRADAYEALNSLIPHYTFDDEFKYIELDFTQGDVLSSTTNIPTNDPARVRAHWNGKLDSQLIDIVNEVKLDARYYIDQGPLHSLEFGLQFTQRQKDNMEFKWNDDYQCAPCGGYVDLPDELFTLVEYPDFLKHAHGSKPVSWLKLNNIKAYNQTMQKIMEQSGIVPIGTIWHHTVFDPSASYINKEATSAAYFKLTFDGNSHYLDWYGDFGFRYLNVENQSSGFLQEVNYIELDKNSSQNELRLKMSYSQPVSQFQASDYDYFLPSFNVNIPLNNLWLIKLAAAKVISFPPIEAIGVNQQITSDDTGTLLLTGGNPDLKPYSANQYDVSLQFYPEKGDYFSLSLFHKDINTFITTATFEQEFEGQVSEDVLARRDPIVEIVNRSENVAGGALWGLEASINVDLFDKCTFCDGISINGNYSQILCNKVTADPIELESIKEPESSIEGLSKHAYSLNLFYDNPPFKAYLGWNWRSAFLHARQGIRTRGIPEHTEKRGQLDARLAYFFDPSFEVFFEAFNITDAVNLEYADIRSRVTHVDYSGVNYKLGIRKIW